MNACPTHARLFGDVHDPDSDISRAIRERGGYALMPELGTRPANQYLPRRAMVAAGTQSGSAQSTPAPVTRGNPAHDGGESAAAAELVRESETILARLFGGLRGKARKRAQPAPGALQLPKAAQSCACGAGQGGCASAKPAGSGLGGQRPAAAGLPVSRLFAEG